MPVAGTVERGRARGFTLFELVVTLSIAALILGIGAPSFTEFRRNARLTGIANDFLSAAELARTEAVKRQKKVSLCAATNAEDADTRRCTTQPVFNGWMVFEAGNCDLPAGAAPIRTHAAIDPSDATAVSANADMSCLTYGSNGFAIEPGGGQAQPHHITICDVRGVAAPSGSTESPARGVSVDASGHASITRVATTISSWPGVTCSATGG
ncbi:MAG TPA: GspH/FimT family pseudopilin [Steroidobacteraceae bacterium]|nr:GspH/FimT family pseudopilin [Steroidobacteraceae bacterium]